MVKQVFLGDRPVKSLDDSDRILSGLIWRTQPKRTGRRWWIVAFSASGFSRRSRQSPRHVHVIDVLGHSLPCQPFDPTVPLRQAVFVPESTWGVESLELFKQTGTHIMLVVDEYGGQGLGYAPRHVREIVGNMPSEDELEKPQAGQREDGSLVMEGCCR